MEKALDAIHQVLVAISALGEDSETCVPRIKEMKIAVTLSVAE